LNSLLNRRSFIAFQGQPAANRCRKHVKSATLRIGEVVLASQLAYAVTPKASGTAAYRGP
jgi:hypothetical protein